MLGFHERSARDWIARNAAAGIGATLIVAFLMVSLTPCPPRIPVETARAVSAHDCHTPQSPAYLTAPCPCGCAAQPAVAGSIARLGVALLLEPPHFAPLAVAERIVVAVLRFESDFITPIDHIPLPA